MNILLPLLAAVLQAGSSITDKFTLSIRRIGYKEYIGASFPLIFIITLVLFLIFRPPISADLFQNSALLFLLALIAISVGNNLFYYLALDRDNLNEIQVFDLLIYVPIIIFVDERNLGVIIPALTASLAIIWSHWERHHFKILKNTKHYVVWAMITGPIYMAILKKILLLWNPISLEVVRSGIMAFLLGFLFYKSFKNISRKGWAYLIAYILLYFGYKNLGIIYTTLVFSIQPLLVYFASFFVLKEKFHWKKAVAFAIVLVSIVVAQIMG
jgi:drug/metabolite transporter (DMT)-like permease